MIKAQRDSFVDIFKGILILWVINIHTVFWSGTCYIPETVRQISLLIMDVPVFFFISGYLSKPVSLNLSIKKTSKQFFNLYSRYIFISILLLLSLSLGALFFEITVDFKSAIISMLKVHPDGKLWNLIKVYGGSLWYIRTYFSILPFIAVAIYLISFRKLKFIILFLPIIVFGCVWYFQLNHVFTVNRAVFYLSFYLFIYLLGVVYKLEEEMISLRYLILSLLFNLILVYAVFFLEGNKLLIQNYKFPPSPPYLIFSLLLIHIFVIIKRLWIYPNLMPVRQVISLLEWCGKNVFYVYLVQGAICSIPTFLTCSLHKYISTFPLYCIVLIFNICVTIFVVYGYVKFEAVAFKFLNKRWQAYYTKRG